MTPPQSAAPTRLSRLAEMASTWEALLEELVSLESPSEDLTRLQAVAEVTAQRIRELIQPTSLEILTATGRPAVKVCLQGKGEPSVLLLGHLDTVWDVGAFGPLFEVAKGIARGPGVFDMKGGLVIGIAALTALREAEGAAPEVTLLCTADEEVGSPTSRALIESEARRHRAVLVLEPPLAGAVKIARKGVGTYKIEIEGRSAHAGLEPERGVNSVVELAAMVDEIAALARPELGTTVTPTVFTGGGRVNVVPAHAELSCDVRFSTMAEAQRLEVAFHDLRARDPEARVRISGGANRPPLETSASRTLFGIAQRVAAELDLGELQGAAVGGGSDGNFTAALGVPTLDGMGIVGGQAHAAGEWADLGSIPSRAALVAGVVEAVAEGVLG
ncbi:MAG: M20 family metallopeptidase [Candidatus Dormibacteria bacterium]